MKRPGVESHSIAEREGRTAYRIARTYGAAEARGQKCVTSPNN
jgi:hypothetical protein